MILDSTNQRLDALTREMQEIKTSIQFTQKEVDDIKISNANQADHSKALQVEIMKICDSLVILTDKLEYLEGQSRKNYLLIDGIAETTGETWTEIEEKVKNIFVEKLQFQRNIELESTSDGENNDGRATQTHSGTISKPQRPICSPAKSQTSQRNENLYQ